MRRFVEPALLVAALAVIVVVAIAQGAAQNVSTYSTYDRGRNGYQALYNVLAREGVPVQRSFDRPGALDAHIGVLAITDPETDVRAGKMPVSFSSAEITTLRAFSRHARIVIFAPSSSLLARQLRGLSVRLEPQPYTNAGLLRHPASAIRAYSVLSGRGMVAFDERVHGYARDRSFWAAIPTPVRAAVWIALAALALALIEANVRFVPAETLGPPSNRDSSSYIRSMAALLRRARARASLVEQLSADAARLALRRSPSLQTRDHLDELRAIAHNRTTNDAAVVRAARCYAAIRKELA